MDSAKERSDVVSAEESEPRAVALDHHTGQFFPDGVVTRPAVNENDVAVSIIKTLFEFVIGVFVIF